MALLCANDVFLFPLQNFHMSFNSRYFFPSSVAFIFSCTYIFDTLRINNHKRYFFITSIIDTSFFYWFFLKLAPKFLADPLLVHSKFENKHERCAILENLLARYATDTPSSEGIVQHKKHHINLIFLVLLFFLHSTTRVQFLKIVDDL